VRRHSAGSTWPCTLAPCKGFTLKLAETYKAIKAARDDFEVIFVSGDRGDAQFKEYFATMPWLASPWDQE
jgi:nucleoredoxin